MIRRWSLFAVALVALAALFLKPDPAAAMGNRCLFVVPLQGFESLVNTCNQCRIGQVIRDRTVGGIQGQRTVAVPAKSKVDLTFHYPGKTRVVSERPCGVNQTQLPYASKNSSTALQEQSCVKLLRTPTGAPAMKNSCTACRMVDLEYKIKNVGLRIKKTRVRANSIALLMPDPAAVGVRIRGEHACPIR